LTNKEIDKINNDLVRFSKSEFLKNEINEAFFLWNQNEYFTKVFNEISETDSNYLRFLDWFIYDYTLVSTERTLATMYFEDNSEKVPVSIIDSYRSIFKHERINGKDYKIKDIIKNVEYCISIEDTVPEESILLSLRIINEEKSKNLNCSKIGHIVAYNKEYKEVIYDSLTNIFKKTKNTPDIICKNYFYVIEKDINNMISKVQNKDDLINNKEKVAHKVLNYLSILDKIKEDKKLKLVLEESNKLSIFNYYDELKNEYGSMELYKNRIVFNNFNELTLNDYIIKFKNDISEVVEDDEISEVWLNTKLSFFDNKSPIEAKKYKKYRKKMEEILTDLELIYESKLSEDEPSINPNYIRKRLNLN
jgi:hypothetical protein